MSVTVAELGKIVGCSTATISRALNNSGAVSPKTRTAILKALDQTAYVPKRSFRERRNRPIANTQEVSNVIEIIFHRHSPVEQIKVGHDGMGLGPLAPLPAGGFSSESFQLSMSFHRQIIDGAIAELSKWGYKSLLQFNSDLLEPRFVSEMNKADKRGVILTGEASDLFTRFKDQCRHPLVLADFRPVGQYDVVTSDNYDGIYQAFDHLYALGHRKIGFAGNQTDILERDMAFRMKMSAANLPINPAWMFSGPPHIEPVRREFERRFASGDRPTAMIGGNDCYAIGLMQAAAGLGISVPGQMSIVGFDDMTVSAMLTPALTTVRVPQAQIGQQAARQLLTVIQSGQPAPRGVTVRLKTELVVRQSTGPVQAS